MSRYIDAERFIADLGFENTEQERKENTPGIVTLADFDRQPTADVAEVKRGKWRRTASDYECSECSYPMDYITPYCPYCGAKMGDDENNE